MPGSFTNAVYRWQDGDQNAQFEIDERIRSFLIDLVRKRRDRKHLPRIDSEGIAYDAFNKFLSDVSKDRYEDLTSRENIKAVLARIAHNFLMNETRRHSAEKRDVSRELSSKSGRPEHLGSISIAESTNSESEIEDSLDSSKKKENSVRGDSPSDIRKMEAIAVQWAVSVEYITELLDEIRVVHPLAEQIFKLSLENMSNVEIAAHPEINLGVRYIQKIKAKMFHLVESRLKQKSI